mmetsp:Transcript_21493/g.67134  ORF Transcript_21493/g.67134 Transcript_21493/m.67134 type:complete len:438 (+) Transcript_21493:33-1346(+)
MAEKAHRGPLVSLRLAALGLAYYSCIYLVKVPMFACGWSAAPSIGGLGFKTCLALAQVFGFAAGKVPSLLVVPKLPQQRLRCALITVIVSAGSCVTLSCMVPPALSLLLVWCASVWLAPAWSLLQRFLEGRRDTESIVAAVSFAFIGSSGLCKGAAVDLMALGLTDAEAVAACAVTGTCVGVLCAYGVAAQPPPSAADVEKRGQRREMTNYRVDCGRLRSEFGVGLLLTVAAYTLLGALRAYRDYFQLELFQAVGLGSSAGLFAQSEVAISLVVLTASAGLGLIEDHRRALDVIFVGSAASGAGLALLTRAHEAGHASGFAWILGLGALCFLAYVPLGTMLFDRLLAAAGENMTSVLLNLVMDTSVLIGTASLLVYKDVLQLRGGDDPAYAYRFFCASAWRAGWAIAGLTLAANVSLGFAVDRRRRVAAGRAKIESA